MVREEKEKVLSLTEFPGNLSLVAHLDYFCGWGGFTARFRRSRGLYFCALELGVRPSRSRSSRRNIHFTFWSAFPAGVRFGNWKG